MLFLEKLWLLVVKVLLVSRVILCWFDLVGSVNLSVRLVLFVLCLVWVGLLCGCSCSWFYGVVKVCSFSCLVRFMCRVMLLLYCVFSMLLVL